MLRRHVGDVCTTVSDNATHRHVLYTILQAILDTRTTFYTIKCWCGYFCLLWSSFPLSKNLGFATCRVFGFIKHFCQFCTIFRFLNNLYTTILIRRYVVAWRGNRLPKVEKMFIQDRKWKLGKRQYEAFPREYREFYLQNEDCKKSAIRTRCQMFDSSVNK